MLADAQQAKRVRTVEQAPRSLVEIQRPSSRCAPSKSAQDDVQSAAASLLHAAPSACALRLRVIKMEAVSASETLSVRFQTRAATHRQKIQQRGIC